MLVDKMHRIMIVLGRPIYHRDGDLPNNGDHPKDGYLPRNGDSSSACDHIKVYPTLFQEC